VNILIAFLLFWAVLFTGSLNGAVALGNLDPAVHTLGAAKVQFDRARKPADGVLQPGDQIIDVGAGRRTRNRTVQRISSHRCAGAPVEGCRAAAPVQLTVRRSGRDVALTVYPRYSEQDKRMLIGFEFGPSAKGLSGRWAPPPPRSARCGT